jgi:hypothetical protein
MTDDVLDPFDPAALRMDQSFAEGLAVKKLLNVVHVAKHGQQDFVRVHPSEDYRISPVALLELKDDREMYLVTPAIQPELAGELAAYTLFTAANRQGVIRLWPVRLPDPTGKYNTWHKSAADAAELAQRKWIRLTPNMNNKCYDLYEASASIPDHDWSEVPPFKQLLTIAFRDRLIDRIDHPVILRLRGLA